MSSCSRVLAPLGTAARPAAPPSRSTSTSMVGLPRMSRISLAVTSWMIDMQGFVWEGILPCGGARTRRRRICRTRRRGGALLAVQLTHRLGHARPALARETVAVFVRRTGRVDWLEEMHVDRSRSYAPASASLDAQGAVDDRGNDRALCGGGQHKGTFLERPQGVALAAGAFGIHNDRRATTD